ncbi:HAUS augmin-like complex subunit 1 [Amia ocellicauda]|uniref:HAUS augmin-like complex subunit 1 n=1 Tax=Amia ocellicauda TaxID=2972642 RepID=UPI003463CE4E
MGDRTAKVTQWLSRLFGEQPVPHYELSARTADLLHQLADSSESRCRDVSLLTADLRLKAAEYSADGSYLQEVLLQGAGLSSSSLSSRAGDCLAALEGSAMALGTKDTSLASLVPAVNDLTAQLQRTERRNTELDQQLAVLRRKHTDALVLHKSLQEDLSKTKDLQEVEKVRAEIKLQNLDFIRAKSADLSFRIETMEDQLSSSGMEESLSHQAILDLSEKLSQLRQETVPLRKKLESYLDLTPNPSLAQVKIEEAKRELAAIDKELTMKVDVMDMALPEQRGRRLR